MGGWYCGGCDETTGGGEQLEWDGDGQSGLEAEIVGGRHSAIEEEIMLR